MNNQAIKKEVNKNLYDLMPQGIEGEIGVGKFRTTFHRIYTSGDGWMGGRKATYVIVEVMGNLIKLKKSETFKDWAFCSTSGGSFPLANAQKEVFGHKMRAAKTTQQARDGGYLESMMR